MLKALYIKIKDAGIFDDPRTSDKILSYWDNEDRITREKKDPRFFVKVPVDTLYYKNVANLLRVLWGERPIPTFRKSYKLVKNDLYFEELAKKTKVKIETPFFFNKENTEQFYSNESICTKRPFFNSLQKHPTNLILDGVKTEVSGGIICHDGLRMFLGVKLYNSFLDLVKIFGSSDTVFKNVELLNKNKNDIRVQEFCKECQKNKKTPLSNIITNKNVTTIRWDSKTNPLSMLMVNNACEKIKKINANLCVPISENDLEKIEKSTGVATFLEGGLATIESIEDWSVEIEFDNQYKSVFIN